MRTRYMELLPNGTTRISTAAVPYATIGNTADSKRAAKTVLSQDERDYLDRHRQTDINMRSNRAVGF